MEAEAADVKPFPQFMVEDFLPAVIEVEQPEVVDERPAHMLRWAEMMEQHPFTAIIGFRNSMKSVEAKGLVLWDLHRHRKGVFEGVYYSATKQLAGKHLRKAKMYLQEMGGFEHWTDLTRGETLMRFEAPGAYFEFEPEGVDASGRGRRGNRLVLDDLLDPKKAVSMADVERVHDAVTRRILPLLKRGKTSVNLFGTPIIEGDIIDWVKANERFIVDNLPILNDAGESNWPEVYDLAAIQALKELYGQKVFEQEFMLHQKGIADSYIAPDLVKSAIISFEEDD